METTKQELAERPGISNQESLVKALMKTAAKPVRYVIPGGKNLHEQVDKATLPSACYNWLRHCESFDKVTLSMAKDPNQYKADLTKVQDFNADGPLPEWIAMAGGREWLARQISNAVLNYKPVAVYVDKTGISVKIDPDDNFGPTSEDWEPYIEFVPRRRPQWGR